MRLSTKGRYSTRLMIDITVYGNGGFVLMKDIARRQNLSEKYLGHLAALLKNAGLINAMRGAHGGLVLARSAAEITLKDIIAAVEGPIFLHEGDEFSGSNGNKVDGAFWRTAKVSVIEVLNRFSLEAMAAEEKARTEEIHYVI